MEDPGLVSSDSSTGKPDRRLIARQPQGPFFAVPIADDLELCSRIRRPNTDVAGAGLDDQWLAVSRAQEVGRWFGAGVAGEIPSHRRAPFLSSLSEEVEPPWL